MEAVSDKYMFENAVCNKCFLPLAIPYFQILSL